MKNKVKYSLIFGLFAGLLLLVTQCDKFTEVKFLTPNNFTLDSSSHEFDVITKQETSISLITVNGNEEYVGGLVANNDTIVNYDNCSVRYIQYEGSVIPAEVTGEWFTITKPDPISTTTHIHIDENNEGTERSLIILTFGPNLMDGNINIKQQKKEN